MKVLRTLKYILCFCSYSTLLHAADVTSVVTPSGSANPPGSMIPGFLPQATGPHTIGDSGIPARVQGNATQIQLGTGFLPQDSGYCAQFDSEGNVEPTGSACGGSGGSPTGPASGDLCSDYPDPTVCAIYGDTKNALSAVPPSRNKDLIADFHLVPADQWGNGDCQVTQGSTTIYCPNTNVPSSVADGHHLFLAQNAHAGSTNLNTTITGWIDSHHFTIAATPDFTTIHTQVIDQLMKTTGGDLYSWGSKQTLVGGTVQGAAAKGTPRLMRMSQIRLNQPGTGGNSSNCTLLSLNPALNTGAADFPGRGAVRGIQTTVVPTVAGGGGLSAVSIASSGLYKSFSGYAYVNGWYVNIPLGQLPGFNDSSCPLNTTVDITFTIVKEGLVGDASTGLPIPNGYDASQTVPTGVPCDDHTHAASTTSDDSGTGFTTYCDTHVPFVSYGYDDTSLWVAAVADENVATALNLPECIQIPTRWFIVKPQPVAAIGFQGYGCLKGPPMLQGGFLIWPDNGNTYPTTLGREIVACVDCAGSAQSNTQMQLTDPINPLRAGSYLHDLTFLGVGTSSTLDDGITVFGYTQWPDYGSWASWNLTGHLFDTAVSATTQKGAIAETTHCIDGVRTNFTGSKNDPAFGVDAFSVGAGVNNFCMIRYRAFDDPYSLRSWPCSDRNGNHLLAFLIPKIELSGAEFGALFQDAAQIGATAAQCAAAVVAVSDGTTKTGFGASGMGAVSLLDPEVDNAPVGTSYYHVQGDTPPDFGQIRILDALAGNASSGTGENDGIGFRWDGTGIGGGDIVDAVTNQAGDYNLVVSGAVANNPMIYDPNSDPLFTQVYAYIDAGKTVDCLKGLGQLTSTYVSGYPVYNCLIPNASLQNPSMTLNGQVASLGGSYTFSSSQFMSMNCNTAQATLGSSAYYPIDGNCWGGSSLANVVNNNPYPQMTITGGGGCQSGNAPGGTETDIFTVYDNGTDTGVKCTITGTNNRGVMSGGPFTTSNGDHIYIGVAQSAAAASAKMYSNFTVTH